MRCADIFTHEWNNLQGYCYCSWWFLCSLLPGRTNLTSRFDEIYLILFMKVVPFIRKWLLVEFESVGVPVKVRCFYSFNLSATKYRPRQHNLKLALFKTFFLCGKCFCIATINVWAFQVGYAEFVSQELRCN